MNVLIVDDDHINLSLFSHLLAGIPEVDLFEESDPQAALNWCQTHRTDLLLLDYMMPGMDGLAFLQQFRNLSASDLIPVIMITADAQTAVRHAALQLSANDFLTKPVNKVELRARVTNMLALRKAHLQQSERAIGLMREVASANHELQVSGQNAANRLATAARYRDPETGAHLQRMAHYARLLATNMGLPPLQVSAIFEAAPLHDIGKIGIPDHILLKPGRLNADEMEIMRTHAAIGAAILNDGHNKLIRNGAVIALTHHEKFDGSGYPHGLRGEAIPLFGRIVAVADVFDALTSSRPYKEAWSMERAFDWLRENAGSHFDPECVTAFLGDIDKIRDIHITYQDEVTA